MKGCLPVTDCGDVRLALPTYTLNLVVDGPGLHIFPFVLLPRILREVKRTY